MELNPFQIITQYHTQIIEAQPSACRASIRFGSARGCAVLHPPALLVVWLQLAAAGAAPAAGCSWLPLVRPLLLAAAGCRWCGPCSPAAGLLLRASEGKSEVPLDAPFPPSPFPLAPRFLSFRVDVIDYFTDPFSYSSATTSTSFLSAATS